MIKFIFRLKETVNHDLDTQNISIKGVRSLTLKRDMLEVLWAESAGFSSTKKNTNKDDHEYHREHTFAQTVLQGVILQSGFKMDSVCLVSTT